MVYYRVQIVRYFLLCIGLDSAFQEMLLVPKNPKVLEGSSLTLSCIHEGEPTSFSSAWSSAYKHSLFMLLFDEYTGQCTILSQNLSYNVNHKCSTDVFNISLSPVLNDMHGLKWTCIQLFEYAAVSSIYVEVPVKNVTMSLEGGKQTIILRCVENESLSMECRSSFSRPPPSISWLIGESYINATAVTSTEKQPTSYNASDETYNYTLSVLMFSVNRKFNNKRIFCNSTNLSDVVPVSSNYSVFDVHYPPTVEPIQNSSIIEGNYLSKLCRTFDANPGNISVIWTRGDNLVSSGEYLNISRVLRNNEGYYTCSARNVMQYSNGSTVEGIGSASFYLNVLYPPDVNQMKNMTAIEGEYVNLHCSVVYGNPYETTIKWIRIKDNRAWYSQTMSIKNITRSDDSTYTCIANNTLRPTYGDYRIGLSSRNVHIEILYKSSINHFVIEGYETQNIVTVNESQRVNFTCSVDSNPKSFINITFEGKLLTGMHGTHELEYSINTTKCTDFGTYICHGNNWLNSPNDTPNTYLIMYVDCAPRQSSAIYPAANVTNVTSVQHVSTTLTFKALAYPTPSIQWYRKLNSSWIKLESESKGKMEIVSSPVVLEYNLTLFNISEEDYGQYRLDISNPFGRHFQLFNLIPRDKPNAPKRFGYDDKNVGETSVTVWWEPGFDGGLPQTFFIQYRDEKYSWSNYASLKDTNEETMNITVNGLKSGTQYHFMIIVSNDLGSRNSDEITITTRDTEKISSFDVVGPAVGGAVGAGLAIVITIIVILVIRNRKSDATSEAPIYQNTSVRDRLSSVFGSGSNDYETLQTRGSEQPYQQLSSFGREGLTEQRTIYENLKLSRSREHPDVGISSGLPTTSIHNESQSVV